MAFRLALKSPETRALGRATIPTSELSGSLVDEVRGNERATSVIRRETVRDLVVVVVVVTRWLERSGRGTRRR